jgi:hypothetical protein
MVDLIIARYVVPLRLALRSHTHMNFDPDD